MATHSVFFPGEFQGQRSLVGYSPLGLESDMTEWLTLSLSPWNGCISLHGRFAIVTFQNIHPKFITLIENVLWWVFKSAQELARGCRGCSPHGPPARPGPTMPHWVEHHLHTVTFPPFLSMYFQRCSQLESSLDVCSLSVWHIPSWLTCSQWRRKCTLISTVHIISEHSCTHWLLYCVH